MGDRVLAVIDAGRRRLLWTSALEVSGRWLCLLAGAGCLLIFARRCLFDFALAETGLAVTALFAVLGVVRAWQHRPSRALTVLTLDERFGLQERLASAYGIDRPRDTVEQAVVEDAELAAQDLDLVRGLPIRLPGGWKILPLLLAVLALAYWQLPHADLLGLRAAAAERQAEISRVRALAVDLRAADEHEPARTLQPRLVRSLAALADSLEAELPSWRGAIRRVNAVFDRYEDELQRAVPYPMFLERFSATGDRRIDRVREAYRARDFASASGALQALAVELQNQNAPQPSLARACDNFALEIGQAELLRQALQSAALELQREGAALEACACFTRAAAELRLLAARDAALAALAGLRESLRRTPGED